MTAVGLFVVGSSLALDASPARAYATPQLYDIPGGPMTDALNRLADMSGAQLAYDAALTRSIKSHGVSGKRTLSEALDELLAGTGLGYKVDPSGEYVAIVLAQADTMRNDAGAEALPAIDIGAEQKERRDGKGAASGLTSQNSYVVPNATTATKTDTPVMNTPINVQTITQKALEDQQATTLQQALQNVSGVTVPGGAVSGVSTRGGGMFVRGFLTRDFYQDGFRVNGSLQNVDFTSMQQFANIGGIELLKGPAAILYGLSEPGGIINITTRSPQETPHYSAQQQVGALAFYRTSLSATGPLASDKSVLYRLDMSFEDNGAPYGSFIDRTHSRNFFVAPVVKWQVDNATWVRAEVNYNNDLSSSEYQFYTPTINGSFVRPPRNNNYKGDSPALQSTVFAALTGAHDFNDEWSLRSRVAFSSTNYDATNSTPVLTFPGADPLVLRVRSASIVHQSSWQTNQDLIGRFDALGAKNTLLLGGDYARFSVADISQAFQPWGFSTVRLADPTYPGVPFSPLVPPQHFETFTRQNTAGLYVQDQIELPYGFHAMAGARYQYIYQASRQSSTANSFVALNPALNTAEPLHAARVTPRFGLLWRPREWVSLYGNYTEGFAANRGTVYPNTLAPPSDAESWEAGVKFELFDGRLRANVDYYDLVKTNIPISDPDTTHLCNGTPSCSILVGKARSSGPEVDIQGEPLPGWNVILTYANQDVRVVEGNTTTSSGSGFISGLAPGQRFPNVPRNLARLWTSYEFQDELLKGLKVGVGYTYHGSQPIFDNTGGRLGAIPLLSSYGTVDLMAGYSFDLDGVKTTAQINATNIFDRTYYTAGVVAVPASPSFNANGGLLSYGAPFNIVGSLKLEF